MKLRIEFMQAGSLERVMEIERASSPDPWPLSAFLAELGHAWSYFRVARRGREILGFVICWTIAYELHVLKLAVAPDARREGVATRLLQEALEAFARQGGGEVSLEVRRSNEAARCLYRSLGFSVVGSRQKYYRQGDEDAVIMKRSVQELVDSSAAAVVSGPGA